MSSNDDNSCSTLPHPAKSNNPAEAESTNFSDTADIFKTTPGIVIPSEEVEKNIPPPKSREELKALQAELTNQSQGPTN